MAKYKNQCSSGSHASRFILLLNTSYGKGDVATNKTPATLVLQLAGGNYDGDNYNPYGSSFYGYQCDGEIVVKNATTNAVLATFTGSSKGTVSNTSAITIASGSVDLPHNADGTLKVKIECSFSGGLSSQASGGSLTVNSETVTTIPRATSLNSGEYYIGNTYSIELKPASNTFTHKLVFSTGENYSFSGSDSTSNHNISMALTNANLYKDVTGAYKDVTATLYTYNGSTQSNANLIGTKTATFSIKCLEATCRPTISATYKDTDSAVVAITGSNQKILKNRSILQMAITTSAKNQASITKVLIDDVQIDSLTSFIDSNPSKSSYVLKCVDSRGFPSAPLTLNINLFDYVNVSCSPKFTRVNATSGKVKVKYQGDYYNGTIAGNTANALTIKYFYREVGTENWLPSAGTSLTPTKSGNTYSQEVQLSQTFDYKKAWEFKMTYSDKIDSDYVLQTVPKGEPMFFANDQRFKFLEPAYLESDNQILDYTVVDTW